MWFGQKLFKNAKIITKIVKIWQFLWNPLLVAPQMLTSGSLIYISIRTGRWWFWRYQMWISQKLPNLYYFTGDFGVLEQFLAKPHLLARQNVTFWRFGKNMSANNTKSGRTITSAKTLKSTVFWKKKFLWSLYACLFLGFAPEKGATLPQKLHFFGIL